MTSVMYTKIEEKVNTKSGRHDSTEKWVLKIEYLMLTALIDVVFAAVGNTQTQTTTVDYEHLAFSYTKVLHALEKISMRTLQFYRK